MRQNTYLADDLHKTLYVSCKNITLCKQYIMWHLFVKVKSKAAYCEPTGMQENVRGRQCASNVT